MQGLALLVISLLNIQCRVQFTSPFKNFFSILFWFVGFCCHFFLKRCFLTFASPSFLNVIFHLSCLLIVCAALAEHDRCARVN